MQALNFNISSCTIVLYFLCYNLLIMQNWDYDLPKNWKPKTDDQWTWFLVRKINYNDLTGLNKDIIQKYFTKIKRQLDPGKRILLEHFLYDKK